MNNYSIITVSLSRLTTYDVSKGKRPLTDTLQEETASPALFLAMRVYVPASFGNASVMTKVAFLPSKCICK